jgi:type IV pilus assembly protein PilW
MAMRKAQRGTGLAELLVGLALGLVAAVVILRAYAGAEGIKRNTVAATDAQQGGAFLMHVLADALANAGNGYATAASELSTCPDTGDIRTTLRPIPVLISAGATADAPDSLVVGYAVASAVAEPMPFAADASAGASWRIRSPLGFAVGDLVAAISLTGQCALGTITAVSAPDADGVVALAHGGVAAAFPSTSLLLDLGPRDGVQRVRYDVADGSLRGQDLVASGATPNPLASNVALLKAQYGIDGDGDGFLDTWVSASAVPWTAASVLAAPAATLAKIKAVRIGLIVRSETWDRAPGGGVDWVLFDCPGTDKARCTGRLAGVLPAGWRYWTHEITVPLRNQIWNGNR